MERIPAGQIEFPQNFSKILSMANENTKEFTEGSPLLISANSMIRCESNFENLLEEDFHNSRVTHPDEVLDEPFRSVSGLYTFMKESKHENHHARGTSEISSIGCASVFSNPKEQKKFIGDSMKKHNRVQSDLKAVKETSATPSYSKHSFHTPKQNHQQSKSELLELRKMLKKQQQIIQQKDECIKSLIKKYEKKIQRLQETNLSLNQQLCEFHRITPRRTASCSLVPGKKLLFHSKQVSINENGRENESPAVKKREILYPNGARSEIYQDGYKVVYFNNRDIKQEFPDGRQVYFFASEQTTKTTFADGLQEIKFSNGQREKIFPDGTKEIKLTDGTVKCIYITGETETVFPNGSIEKVDKNGIKTIKYVDGRQETVYFISDH